MKQAQNARKGRARPSSRKNNGGKSNNAGNNRQDNKVRGNPKQLLEKYKTQAREATQAGDRVQAEYYYQFADHYQRILNDMRGPNSAPQQDDDADDNFVDGNISDDEGEQQPQQQQRQNNRGRGRRNRNADVQDGDAEDDIGNVDPTAAEQPIEVHPELDLMDQPETAPRRRTRGSTGTGRGRRPRKPADEGGEAAEAAAPQDDAAA